MKQLYRAVLGIILAVLDVMILSRTWGSGHQSGKTEIAQLIKKPKTLCVGRFLLDLPGDAHIEIRQARVDGFEITSFDEDWRHGRNWRSGWSRRMKHVATVSGGR